MDRIALKRMEVYRKYARPESGVQGRVYGKPMQCRPSKSETESGRIRNGGTHKIIFNTREAAEAAARELETIDGSKRRTYLCNYGRHSDHYHFTHDREAERNARFRQRSARRSA